MDWSSLVVVTVAVFAFLVWKQVSLISFAEARRWLQQGAQIIDVRSESEFRGQHLPQAENIPLDQLSNSISSRFPDKDQPLLLHCLSGGRSGLAKRILKGMGYSRVANLGSFRRARKLTSGN